jgi:hypothetical protein
MWYLLIYWFYTVKMVARTRLVFAKFVHCLSWCNWQAFLHSSRHHWSIGCVFVSLWCVMFLCEALKPWSVLTWYEKKTISFLTQNLVSITDASRTILFMKIIASETYTYILCYRNSRFSSVKAADITTVFSCFQLFFRLVTCQSSMTYYWFQSTISVSWWFSRR